MCYIRFFGLNMFISKSNNHGNYNIVIYIHIIGLERKQYCLFGSSPKFHSLGNQIVKNFFYNDIGIQAIHGLSGIIDQDSLFNVTLSGLVSF